MTFAQQYAGRMAIAYPYKPNKEEVIIFGDEITDDGICYVWVKSIRTDRSMLFNSRKQEFRINVYYQINDNDTCFGCPERKIQLINFSKNEIENLIAALNL